MPDIQFQQPLEGEVTAFIHDNNGNPANTLEASEPFSVHVDWEVNNVAASVMGGTWQLDVYAESIGDGFEGQLGFVDVNVVAGQTNYTAHVVVPAHTLPDNPPPPPPPGRVSGAYKLILVLSHRNGGTTTSVAGLVELPLVLIR